jgi:predicted anti-sigma-YlaC factor YlaD
MTCRTAQMAIGAARDGEVGTRQQRALDRHLAGCESCRSARRAIEGVLAAVDGLDSPIVVPVRVEHEVLRRVRALAQEESGDRFGHRVAGWFLGLAPGLAATAVVVIAVVGIRVGTQQESLPARITHTTVDRLAKRKVPDEPPPELASRPDLFVDLPILRDLEKLRHYDSIATMEDDDPARPADDPSPSNG